jgi:CRP/FNR family transcriptional regulator, anaerobic regulatory protein
MQFPINPELLNVNVAAKPSPAKNTCSTCNVRELCLPVGFKPKELEQLNQVVSFRMQLKRGQHVYEAGEKFKYLYAVRSGCCKTSILDADGHEQITGFHLPGDLIGMDGINDDVYICEAIALENSQVCAIPLSGLEELSTELPGLSHQVFRILSKGIVQELQAKLLLAQMTAEQRLAAFLLNLSERYAARGFSPRRFHLRMKREEIGNFLGIQLETVSRLFSKLAAQGIITVKSKDIEILDITAIKRLLTDDCFSTF